MKALAMFLPTLHSVGVGLMAYIAGTMSPHSAVVQQIPLHTAVSEFFIFNKVKHYGQDKEYSFPPPWRNNTKMKPKQQKPHGFAYSNKTAARLNNHTVVIDAFAYYKGTREPSKKKISDVEFANSTAKAVISRITSSYYEFANPTEAFCPEAFCYENDDYTDNYELNPDSGFNLRFSDFFWMMLVILSFVQDLRFWYWFISSAMPKIDSCVWYLFAILLSLILHSPLMEYLLLSFVFSAITFLGDSDRFQRILRPILGKIPEDAKQFLRRSNYLAKYLGRWNLLPKENQVRYQRINEHADKKNKGTLMGTNEPTIEDAP